MVQAHIFDVIRCDHVVRNIHCLHSNASQGLDSLQPIGAFQSEQSVVSFCHSFICRSQVRIWLWAIGYSVAFGPVLGKMYRVYYIFNNPKPNKKRVMMN